jgi:glycosyltransferase involved in cell wall biosynthesis
MKILAVNNFFNSSGGSEKIMIKEAEMLERKGHSVYYFATNKPPLLDENYTYLSEFVEYPDLTKKTTLQKQKYFLQTLYNAQTEDKMQSILDKVRPDIVHIHNFNIFLTLALLKPLLNNNIPVVRTIHDAVSLCPQGLYMLKNEVYCEKHLCTSGNILPCLQYKCKDDKYFSSLKAAIRFLYNKHSLLAQRIDHYICPSEIIANLAICSGIKEEKISVISNFCEENILKSYTNENHQKYLLCIARFTRNKGVDVLIQAMKLVSPEIKLHIVGSGPEEERLKALVSKLELKNIEFTGHLESDKLIKQYQNALAVVVPSITMESFGLTVVEAFAAGKPVIATNIGALPELVKDNVTGLCVAPSSPEQLANAISELSENPKKAHRMGLNAREAAQKYYSPQIYGQKILELFEQLIKLKS